MTRILVSKIDKYVTKHLFELNKIYNMSFINQKDFWDNFKNSLVKNCKNPNFISGYKARKIHGFFEPALKSLSTKGYIRTRINDKGNVEYAEEDILIFKDLRNTFGKLEESGYIKKTTLDGEKKYLVFDFQSNTSTIDEHETGILIDALDGLKPFFNISKK